LAATPHKAERCARQADVARGNGRVSDAYRTRVGRVDGMLGKAQDRPLEANCPVA
jgi:hypothetical protein